MKNKKKTYVHGLNIAKGCLSAIVNHRDDSIFVLDRHGNKVTVATFSNAGVKGISDCRDDVGS